VPPQGSGPRREAGVAGDRIRLTGLRVFAHHGALAHEAEHGQVFVIDVDLGMDLAPAGTSDDLDQTVDYGRLAKAVAEVVAGRRRKLIEAVAEDVARLVLGDPRVRDVRVRVTKPHAPIAVDAEVSVEVVRGRSDPLDTRRRRRRGDRP
jgi:dihydroneopterin aldolase